MSNDPLDPSADEQISRRVVLGRIAGAGVAAAAASAALGGSNALAQHLATSTPTTSPTEGATLPEPDTTAPTEAAGPTVVLVHGSFADASGFNDVIQRLQALDYTTLAPPNPLRTLASDAAYIRSVLDSIDGPIVLVAHSYGGMVVTNAATGNTNVKALVYINGFAPAQGETAGDLVYRFPGSLIIPENLTVRPYPTTDPNQSGQDAYINADVFHEAFAADLDPQTTAVMAATQRPIDLATLQQASGPPAWETIPSWFIIGTEDNTIPPDLHRFMAERSGGELTEIDASHVVMMSQPQAVVDVILAAVTAVSTGGGATGSTEAAATSTS
jgi:pimeloyl-ACP methyl ester carboxylesterase